MSTHKNIFQLKEVSAKVNAAAETQKPLDWEDCKCKCKCKSFSD
ncbi:hypothetical protein [Polyangium mundeleinium]|uniref:Uncharacterized protein n=1 Tax=Polyangium mundeleinium TaxID=2995306 RepID=A0ABT5F6V0_9BACT|nr:hypothetical protein [Polyangium mundeleinium]MDC0749197.1 hypothetical protein [Polyangium mundeleinium]